MEEANPDLALGPWVHTQCVPEVRALKEPTDIIANQPASRGASGPRSTGYRPVREGGGVWGPGGGGGGGRTRYPDESTRRRNVIPLWPEAAVHGRRSDKSGVRAKADLDFREEEKA